MSVDIELRPLFYRSRPGKIRSMSIPFGDLAWLVLAAVVAGVATGLLAGVFGVGGGAIAVPVLYELFRLRGVSDAVRMQLCIGTSLAIILPTAWRSYRAHKAHGAVIPEVLRVWTLPTVVGVLLGSVIATVAPSAIFKLAFVLIAAIITAKMWFISDRWRIADDLPGRWTMSVYGFSIGLGSSLMGISGARDVGADRARVSEAVLRTGSMHRDRRNLANVGSVCTAVDTRRLSWTTRADATVATSMCTCGSRSRRKTIRCELAPAHSVVATTPA